MAAVHYNFPDSDALLIGEDGTIRVLVTDDGTASGNPVNCGAFAMSFVIEVPETGTNVVTKTTAAGSVTTSSVAGTDDAVDIAYLVADTSGLRPGIYDYALVRTDSGEKRRLVWGTIPILDAAMV